ncbi:hypothetical protein ACFHYQ_06310 [Sphaerimonospora cavernae]|uniref:Uncharacterized protein n=1 Tax=Sphaerimonospora cavernae TaxID=1740611 RepID=A0ABV6U0B8_9ACTN
MLLTPQVIPEPHRVQRAIIVALLTLPLLVIVILSLPVWVTWPWLKQERRTDVLKMVEKVTDTLKALMRANKETPGA